MQSLWRSILRKSLGPPEAIILTISQPPVRTRPVLALFSSSAVPQSGHNRWSKIRHDKGKNDANRSVEFSHLSQEICFAAKIGGPDSDNLRLMAALNAAKKAGMPKEKIESAVKRGQGISASGGALEPVQVECIGPGSVALIVECLTDNKLGCLQDIKIILRKNHCTITPTSYLFARKGIVRLVPGNHSYDTILESSLDVEGTEDVKEVEPEDAGARTEVEVITNPARTVAVADELKNQLPGIEILKSYIGWVPNDETLVSVEDEQVTGELITLIDALESSSDVNQVYTNTK